LETASKQDVGIATEFLTVTIICLTIYSSEAWLCANSN